MTTVIPGWDNADTGRASDFSVPVRERGQQFSSGVSSFKQYRKCRSLELCSNVSESREVMNVRQASQYLGISPDTLYRYITEGEIPAFKLGNRWKLRKTILDRWMERKMSQVHAKRR